MSDPVPLWETVLLDLGGIPVITTVVVLGIIFVVSAVLTLTKVHDNSPFDLLFHKRVYYKPLKVKWLREWIQHYFLDVTYGEIFLMIVHICLCVVWFLFHNIEDFSIIEFDWRAISNGFGRVALFNFILVLFPAHRLSLVKLIFGVGVEHSLKYHKILGVLTFAFVFIHFTFVLFETVWLHYITYIFMWEVDEFLNQPLPGLVSGISMLAMAIFIPLRRKIYFLFYYVHLLTSIVSVVFLVFHRNYTTIGLFSFAIFFTLLDFCYRFFFGFFIPSKLLSVKVHEKAGLISLEIQKSFLMTNYQPGQIVWLWIAKKMFLSHPFTITSSRLERNNSIKLTIKKKGHFTKKLFDEALEDPEKLKGSMLRIDGPYGTSFQYCKYESLLLCSEGSAAAVSFAILMDIHLQGVSLNVIFVWQIRNVGYLKLYEERLDELRDKFDIRIHITQGKIGSTYSEKSLLLVSKDVSVKESQFLTINEQRETNERPMKKTETMIEGKPNFADILNEFTSNKVGVMMYGGPFLKIPIKNACHASKKRIHLFESEDTF